MIDRIAAEARGLSRHFDREVAMISVIHSGHPAPLAFLALGDRNRVPAEPRLLFRLALGEAADAVVLVHNHVDGGPPSAADLAVTRRLVAAGAVIGVPLTAHLVVGGSGWYDCVTGSRRAWS